MKGLLGWSGLSARAHAVLEFVTSHLVLFKVMEDLANVIQNHLGCINKVSVLARSEWTSLLWIKQHVVCKPWGLTNDDRRLPIVFLGSFLCPVPLCYVHETIPLMVQKMQAFVGLEPVCNAWIISYLTRGDLHKLPRFFNDIMCAFYRYLHMDRKRAEMIYEQPPRQIIPRLSVEGGG